MKCIDCNLHDAVDGASMLCEQCSPQRGDPLSTIVNRVVQANESHDYHIGISDSERLMMEQASFNFHTHTGRKMRIPPRLFSDLKSKGVSMRHMEADGSLEQ